MITRADLDEAILLGTAKAQRLLAAVMQDFTQPHMQAAQAAAWQNMGGLKKTVIQQVAPEAYAKGEKKFGRK